MGLNDNCPLGTDTDPNAPWNHQLEKEVEVTVSITLSKSIKILVDDYKISKDENDKPYVDFSECNLKEAAMEYITLPDDTWDIDDFEVVL